MDNSNQLSVTQGILKIETAVSEGLQSGTLTSSDPVYNSFGRQVLFSKSEDLSYVSGLCAAGVRGGAMLSGIRLAGNYNQLAAAARQHLPFVVHYTGNHNNYHSLIEAGCFQLFSSNIQEAVDFTLIAHRIAELSLIPGICAHEGVQANTTFRSDEMLSDYLGDPDKLIKCPTPAQRLLFGNNRRRVPNWFSLDAAMLMGSSKNDQAETFETAANHKFFYAHLPELVDQAFDEFNLIAGTAYSPVTSHEIDDAQHVVLVQGAAFHQVAAVVNTLREQNQKVACLNLHVLRPLPVKQLLLLLKGKKSVTVLENMQGSQSDTGPLHRELMIALQEGGLSPKVYAGLFGSALREPDIVAVFQNMIRGDKDRFYLGVGFAHDASKYPKYEVLLGNIKREYPGIQQSSLTGIHVRETPENISLHHPNVIRRYKDRGPAYTRLSRFFDDVGYFYKSGNREELIADPFQALPLEPAATANFADLSSLREWLPVFEPSRCTGCGACFVQCPHAAIPPVVIGLENLIKAGAEIASEKGIAIRSITPQVKNLAKIGTQIISENGGEMPLGECLQKAFDLLVSQTGLKEDKLRGVKKDFEAVREAVCRLPIAVTDAFFRKPEVQNAGSGELFSLAIDPHACTGCGICAEVCEPEALRMTAQSPDLLSELQTVFELWEALPDTSGDTINRMHHDDEYNSFAAILLSRNYYTSMSGGNIRETGAPAKMVMHLLTAVAESAIQPKALAQIRELEEIIAALNDNIHKKLSEALPKEHFEGLAEAIEEFRGEQAPLDLVIGKLGRKELMKQVNTIDVQRKIELVRSLNDLKWALAEGPAGVGRARFGIALTDAGPWSSEYPYNNFTSPVAIHWDGSAPELALGLYHGTLRHVLDNIKLMRRARLEAKDKYDPGEQDLKIARLSWNDLTEAEKELVPPIFVAGDKRAMNDRNWNGLSSLLAGDWPVKVIIMNDASVGPDDSASVIAARHTSTLLSAVALKNAFVMQGGMGEPGHLFNGFLEGLHHPKPAFFSVLAPDPEQHNTGNGTWPDLANIALNTRAFPSLQFNPYHDRPFFSSAFDLEDNPSARADWHTGSISYNEAGEDQTMDYTFTWADWAFTQKAWEKHFDAYTEEQGEPLPLADYLKLDVPQRSGKAPVIIRSQEGQLLRYTVSSNMVSAASVALSAWNTWRELAGTLIRFPEKLQKEVETALTAKYESDLDDARADFNTRLKDQEQAQLKAIRQKLKDKLVELSKQGKLN